MQIIASLSSFLDAIPGWFTAITGLVSAASAVTALTPSPKDDRVMGGIVRVLEILALNVGHAKRTGRADPRQ